MKFVLRVIATAVLLLSMMTSCTAYDNTKVTTSEIANTSNTTSNEHKQSSLPVTSYTSEAETSIATSNINSNYNASVKKLLDAVKVYLRKSVEVYHNDVTDIQIMFQDVWGDERPELFIHNFDEENECNGIMDGYAIIGDDVDITLMGGCFDKNETQFFVKDKVTHIFLSGDFKRDGEPTRNYESDYDDLKDGEYIEVSDVILNEVAFGDVYSKSYYTYSFKSNSAQAFYNNVLHYEGDFLQSVCEPYYNQDKNIYEKNIASANTLDIIYGKGNYPEYIDTFLFNATECDRRYVLKPKDYEILCDKIMEGIVPLKGPTYCSDIFSSDEIDNYYDEIANGATAVFGLE